VSYTYPFPNAQRGGDGGEEGSASELTGEAYQIEMMKMLEKVNVDNNCVGWYQSMYLGTMCTADVVGYQYR
jgi:translation initiation factor 3 subunit H